MLGDVLGLLGRCFVILGGPWWFLGCPFGVPGGPWGVGPREVPGCLWGVAKGDLQHVRFSQSVWGGSGWPLGRLGMVFRSNPGLHMLIFLCFTRVCK